MNWIAFTGLVDRSREHESGRPCPGCGGPMASPRVPAGYHVEHCRQCARDIERRQAVWPRGIS